MAKHFRYSQPLRAKIRQRIKDEILPRILDRKINLFLRTNDEITYDPILHGLHEPVVVSLLQFLAAGRGDFLLDIGANVGLTTVLSGNEFGRIDCVEPNRLVAAVLGTNLALNLRTGQYHVHEVGLGDKAGTAELLVPRHNFGGGFILEGNAYDHTLLASKDNFARFDESNYLAQTVDMVESDHWLAALFEEYRAAGLRSGVVKIDAEGFEPTIIRSLLEVAPRDFRLAVVFENWASQFDPSPYHSERHHLSFAVLQKIPAPQTSGTGRLFRFLRALVSGVHYRLVSIAEASGRPDNLVLYLDPGGAA